MDSPISECDDYVFLSSRSNSIASNCRSDAQDIDASDVEDSELTLTRERCNSLMRRSHSSQAKQQLQTERLLKTSSLKRSRHPSDNGGVSGQLFTSRKSNEDFPSGRGLRLLHRTLSLSIEGRGQRTQSMSESPSISSNSGLLASFDAGAASHSSTSSLVRMRRSAKGQSAPSLSFTSMESSISSSNGGISSARRYSNKGPSEKSSTPTNPLSKQKSPKMLSPRTLSPKRTSVLHSPAPVASQASSGSSPASAGAAAPSDGSHCGGIQYLPAHLRSEQASSDIRRWSLPSSGYGTHATDSADSSQYSSKENLQHSVHHVAHNAAQTPQRTQHSSNETNAPHDDKGAGTGKSSPLRPRSRSLSSPARSPGSEQDVMLMNSVYKERFPKAQEQMEEKLQSFYKQLELLLGEEGNAIARYSLRQILELARDCLMKSQNNQLSSAYFFEITQKVEVLLQECEEKSKDTVSRVLNWGRQLLVIVSRTARLLECLEFDPAEFLQLLTAAEGQMRQTQKLQSDIPRYIISKLGLNKDPLDDLVEISNDQLSACGSASESDTPDTRLMFGQPSEEDFQVVKLISNGAYGAVHLVRHRASRQRFAMKKVKKTHLVLRNQVDQAFAERDILSFADNPFVVSLLCTFETKKYLCMVMEFVEGGDCASLLKQIQVLPLELARMYFAEMVLALEYLHNYGIVHRDLKPSNLLISSEGHIKLTDFGLSRIGLMNLTTNLYEAGLKDFAMFTDAQIYGTPEYISPEVILLQGYGKPVDWWAAGIILYQFLVGCVPFMADSAEDLFALLVSDPQPTIEWPDNDDELPAEAVDLICLLLNTNPVLRLGTEGAHEVKDHEFFSGLDWAGLLKEKSEFVPQLDHDEDTSYFDPRSDRYNHDSNSDSDEHNDSDDPLFQSFGSFSPRFSHLSGSASNTPPPSPQPLATPQLDLPFAEAQSTPPPTQLPVGKAELHSAQACDDSSQPGLRRTTSLRRANISHLANDTSVTRSPSAHQLPARTLANPNPNKAPLVLNKGSLGFGFTIRTIRVYQGDSNFFLLHHLVVFVRPGSPAHAAGLRIGDLVTHVNDLLITGLPHPKVIASILRERRLTLRAVPLSATPIRSDGRPRVAQSGRMVSGYRHRRSRATATQSQLGGSGHSQQVSGESPRQGPPSQLRCRMLKEVEASGTPASSTASQVGRPQSLCASQSLSIQPAQQRTRARAASSSSVQCPTSPRRKSTHCSVAPSPLAVSPSQESISPQGPTIAARQPMRGRVGTFNDASKKL